MSSRVLKTIAAVSLSMALALGIAINVRISCSQGACELWIPGVILAGFDVQDAP